jgi:hypothetical protein
MEAYVTNCEIIRSVLNKFIKRILFFYVI